MSGLCAPAVLSLLPATRLGLKLRGDAGQGAPFGPELIENELIDVWFCRMASQGSNSVSTG